MTKPTRIPLHEMTAIAHARGLSIEPDYALGQAFMYVGRHQYVAELKDDEDLRLVRGAVEIP